MKLTLKILPILAIITLFGCKDELTSIKFDASSATGEFTINSNAPAGEFKDTTTSDIDLAKVASENGADVSKLKSLKLLEAKAVITNGKTFDPLTKLSIQLEADGMPAKTILVKDPVNGVGASTINFDVDQSLDLLPYFKANNLKIYSVGTLGSPVTEEIKMKLEFKYKIEAGL